ncbi:hypothetical protein [Agromyces sp. Marseille-Q5079]|uniref:hypothetical protein n=1 Tax=Agromyces sp. Marseille-Q5079 TaxID=3439059 RepID=UPI003D9CAD9F
MNTALVGTGQASIGPIAPRTMLRRMSRRAGLALTAWGDTRPRRRELSREELAERHERRQVAAQLQEERFRTVAVGRML